MLNLANWMKIGLNYPDVIECRDQYLSDCFRYEGKIRACALGIALIGKLNSPTLALDQYRNMLLQSKERDSITILAHLLGISTDVARTIESLHSYPNCLSTMKIISQIGSLS